MVLSNSTLTPLVKLSKNNSSQFETCQIQSRHVKSSWDQNLFGSKFFWEPKLCLGPKSFLNPKFFGPKIFLIKLLCTKIFCLGQKKFGPKIFGQQFFLDENFFLMKNILGEKFVWAINLFGLNVF